ncbi:transglycosylase SLT domain-containing protein [Dyella japonica]|uniref:Muraminidase n=1 Tax=Dyella japonica A8 TaxID=1217721 RepID=A0A075JYQ1_9GAMM|nr:transglycosylase SLT domain-containing protein [Dyella japonica]AIF47074.1 muraminidase [Dyella japonica A8]
MDDGFFPLGVNGFPHGGVHFGAHTAHTCDQASGVRCLADGEIVAYKLDDTYPKLHFTQDNHWAMYSTGFVLVRHTLTLPPDPRGGASADDAQTLYSLYMHLASWSTYLADGALKRPGWWIGVEAFRIGHADTQSGGTAKGARVRTEPKPAARGRYTSGQLVGFLPEGSEVRIDEKRGPWGHIAAITAGAMISADSGGVFGGDDDLYGPWHRSDGAPNDAPVTPTGDWGWIYLHEQHAVTEPTRVGSVVIPPTPIPIKAGTLLGQLGEYIDYEHASPLPPVPARQLLHLEVFADDGFAAWLARSRARAASLPADQKTTLLITAGATLTNEPSRADRQVSDRYTQRFSSAKPTPDSPAEGHWVKVQPYGRPTPNLPIDQPDGPPVWIERTQLATVTATTPAWSRFPLQPADNGPVNALAVTYTRAALDALDGADRASDDQGHHWWRIEIGTTDGRAARGWVRDTHTGTTWESSWAWPGFELVDATTLALADAFQRNLVSTGSAEGLEVYKYQGAIARVEASPLFQRLAAILGKRKREGVLHRLLTDYPVNARAMQEALRIPWLAHAISHLILRYESEWGGSMSRWEALTPFMRDARENWQCEMQRIAKLQWWDEVRGKVEGFPESPAVYHIHPVALVGNFASPCKCIVYDAILVERASPEYRDSQIVIHSHYRTPIDRSSGRFAGNSRRAGDAIKQVQIKAIDALVEKAKARHLCREDIAMILATARHESGFNPDAAAGTTSASGLGQFVDQTASTYGINSDEQRFDVEKGAEALVKHYMENKRLAQNGGATGRNLFTMTYAYHHDGPSLAYGGRQISESSVMPWFDTILSHICLNIAD